MCCEAGSMKVQSKYLLVLVTFAVSLAPAFASELNDSGVAAASTPIAWVYVSSLTSQGVKINAYAASANGTLVAIAGSPLNSQGAALTSNGKWLFAASGSTIQTFGFGASGQLTPKTTVDAQAFGGHPFNLFLDRKGGFLYDGASDIDGSNFGYQYWKIVSTTGQLDYLGDSKGAAQGAGFAERLSSLANNVFS